MTDLNVTLSHLQTEIEDGLSKLVKDLRPDELYDSVRYVIAGGGKRLRPVLSLLSAKIFDVSTQHAMSVALAVELVHNFSLVHDDIMDHADSRRGRESVHVLWDTETAILCGDVLLALATECISQARFSHQSNLTRVYGTMIRELCEGQALDMEIGLKPDLTTDDYLHMVDGKTGGLISASLEMGGIIGDANADVCMILRESGKSIGRAFQILDDLLDLIADDHRWGKVQGGDLIEGKGTYLLAESRQRATGEDAEFFAKIRPGTGLSPEDIPTARSKMNALGVLEDARQQVHHYTSNALKQINSISGNTDRLEALITHMGKRIY